MLGKHPKDGRPVELYAGRYGPYVKHGDVNATVPDRDRAEAITLEEAVALVDEKAGRAPSKPARTAATTRKVAKEPEPVARKRTAKKPAAEAARPAARKTASAAAKTPAAKKPAATKKTTAAKKPAPTARKTPAAKRR